MGLFDDPSGWLKSAGDDLSSAAGVVTKFANNPLVSGGFGLLSGVIRNQGAASAASAANEFSAAQYASRYQTQVRDLEAAGLSPMLAYGQSPGGSPTGQQASVENVGAAGIAARASAAQIANVEADTDNKRASARLIDAQVSATNASAAQSTAQVGQISAQVDKLKAETANLPTEGKRLGAALNYLDEQRSFLVNRGMTESEVRNQLRAIVSKIETEIPNIALQNRILELDRELKSGDVQAMKDLGNLGRDAKELAPIIHVLTTLLRAGR